MAASCRPQRWAWEAGLEKETGIYTPGLIEPPRQFCHPDTVISFLQLNTRRLGRGERHARVRGAVGAGRTRRGCARSRGPACPALGSTPAARAPARSPHSSAWRAREPSRLGTRAGRAGSGICQPRVQIPAPPTPTASAWACYSSPSACFPVCETGVTHPSQACLHTRARGRRRG